MNNAAIISTKIELEYSGFPLMWGLEGFTHQAEICLILPQYFASPPSSTIIIKKKIDFTVFMKLLVILLEISHAS